MNWLGREKKDMGGRKDMGGMGRMGIM